MRPLCTAQRSCGAKSRAPNSRDLRTVIDVGEHAAHYASAVLANGGDWYRRSDGTGSPGNTTGVHRGQQDHAVGAMTMP
jgi:hypothetical protein